MASAMLSAGTILREPLDVTLRFVNWHLEQGVDQIFLCFDNPKDPAIKVLKDHQNVHCIPCDEKFWHRVGVQPTDRFTRRQNAAMQYIYDNLSEGWFLNLDGDELVYLKGRTLKEEVSQQPETVKAVLIRPAERVQCAETPNVIQFRSAMPNWCCRAVYGDLSAAMRKRQGLCGHSVGKSVTRAGMKKHFVRQHFLQSVEHGRLTDLVLGPKEGAYLLHFVDQGFEIWCSKLEWRLSSRGYRRDMATVLMEALESAEPETALRRIYDCMFTFTETQFQVLDRVDARLAIDLAQNDAFARHFPAEITERPLQTA